jgi:hypothetical protein
MLAPELFLVLSTPALVDVEIMRLQKMLTLVPLRLETRAVMASHLRECCCRYGRGEGTNIIGNVSFQVKSALFVLKHLAL